MYIHKVPDAGHGVPSASQITMRTRGYHIVVPLIRHNVTARSTLELFVTDDWLLSLVATNELTRDSGVGVQMETATYPGVRAARA